MKVSAMLSPLEIPLSLPQARLQRTFMSVRIERKVAQPQ
jgi:hypothetical protein